MVQSLATGYRKCRYFWRLMLLALLFSLGFAARAQQTSQTVSQGPFPGWARFLTINTSLGCDRVIPTSELAKLIAIGLPVESDIRVAQGEDMRTSFSLMNRPLYEFLDRITIPNLRWMILGKSIIIYSDLRAHVFPIARKDIAKVAALMREQVFQKKLWGGEAQPPSGEVFICFDEITGTLLVQESQNKIDEVYALLVAIMQKSLDECLQNYCGHFTRKFKVNTREVKSLDELKRTASWNGRELGELSWNNDGTLTISGTNLGIRDLTDTIYSRRLGWAVTDEPRRQLKIQVASPEEFRRDPSKANGQGYDVSNYLMPLMYREGFNRAAELGVGMMMDRSPEQGVVITLCDIEIYLNAVKKLLEGNPRIKFLE